MSDCRSTRDPPWAGRLVSEPGHLARPTHSGEPRGAGGHGGGGGGAAARQARPPAEGHGRWRRSRSSSGPEASCACAGGAGGAGARQGHRGPRRRVACPAFGTPSRGHGIRAVRGGPARRRAPGCGVGGARAHGVGLRRPPGKGVGRPVSEVRTSLERMSEHSGSPDPTRSRPRGPRLPRRACPRRLLRRGARVEVEEGSDDDWVTLVPPGGGTSWERPPGAPSLAFQRIEDFVTPTWPGGEHPQQFHLDLQVPDLEEGSARARGGGPPTRRPALGERWLRRLPRPRRTPVLPRPMSGRRSRRRPRQELRRVHGGRRRELLGPHGHGFSMLGPNGAGKTTTVRMMTTLSVPTSGTARVAGFDVVADPDAAGTAWASRRSRRRSTSCSPAARTSVSSVTSTAWTGPW